MFFSSFILGGFRISGVKIFSNHGKVSLWNYQWIIFLQLWWRKFREILMDLVTFAWFLNTEFQNLLQPWWRKFREILMDLVNFGWFLNHGEESSVQKNIKWILSFSMVSEYQTSKFSPTMAKEVQRNIIWILLFWMVSEYQTSKISSTMLKEF